MCLGYADACVATSPLAGRETVPFAALQGNPFILFETGFVLNGIILDACRSAGFAPDIAARSSSSRKWSG
ncbi:LysR substrate-binding domain-containing protein [Rhizobium sp. BR 315]